MTHDQITELWKLRLFILRIRNLHWISTTFFLPYILLFLPLLASGFRRQVFLGYSIVVGVSLVHTMTLYLLLRSIKKRRFRGKYAYQKSILLYSLYDLYCLMVMGMGLWMTAVLTINSSKMILAILLCQLFVFILGVFTSRGILRLKIRLSNQPNKFNQHLPMALAISSTLPSMGVFVAAAFSNSPQKSWLVFQVLAIGMGSLFTYLSTLGICEIIIIGLRKWPQIRRTNSRYSIDWQDP